MPSLYQLSYKRPPPGRWRWSYDA